MSCFRIPYFSPSTSEANGIYSQVDYSPPPSQEETVEPPSPMTESIYSREGTLEVLQGNDRLARVAYSSSKESKSTNPDVLSDTLDHPPTDRCPGGTKKLNLEDESTWAEEPLIIAKQPPETTSQKQIAQTGALSMCESSEITVPGGYVVERLIRTEVRGNPELLQEAEKAFDSLYVKPSSGTFFVTLHDGERKEFYRPPFGLETLLSAGQRLAMDCEYPGDITASMENHRDGVVYACITFHKRMDHAQKTYRELREKWKIEDVPEQPLKFAVSRGIWGMLGGDSKQKIELLERKRTQIIKQFCQELYEDGRPKEPAFLRIYRPMAEQRRKFLAGSENIVEYIAATDCIMFIYKPVLT